MTAGYVTGQRESPDHPRPGTLVRCFFEGVPDPPEPFDLLFARVPNEDESVMYRESRWFVTRVTWTQEGPYLDLSYGDL